MEEDIDPEQLIKSLKKIPLKYSILIIILCLFFLFFQLGFIYGFNQSFKSQENYYEEKIERFCICQEELDYTFPKPLEIEFNLTDS